MSDETIRITRDGITYETEQGKSWMRIFGKTFSLFIKPMQEDSYLVLLSVYPVSLNIYDIQFEVKKDELGAFIRNFIEMEKKMQDGGDFNFRLL